MKRLLTVACLVLSAGGCATKPATSIPDPAAAALAGSWVTPIYHSRLPAYVAYLVMAPDGTYDFELYSDQDCRDRVLSQHGVWKVEAGALTLDASDGAFPPGDDLFAIGTATEHVLTLDSLRRPKVFIYQRVQRCRSEASPESVRLFNAAGDAADDMLASSLLDRAIALSPNYALAYEVRGILRRDQGRFEAALADHDAALALTPGEPYAYFWRGLTRKKAGDLAGATDDISEAIRIYPGKAQFVLARAALYEQRGMRDAAIVDYRRVLTLEPASTEARGALFRLDVTP